jgi:hypothetical protein
MPVTDTSLTLYQEVPLTYPTIYAGLVFLNVPPSSGTWQAQYGANATAALAWNLAATDLETVLNALASVTANGGLDVLMIANAPVNEFVYQWRTSGATGFLEITGRSRCRSRAENIRGASVDVRLSNVMSRRTFRAFLPLAPNVLRPSRLPFCLRHWL